MKEPGHYNEVKELLIFYKNGPTEQYNSMYPERFYDLRNKWSDFAMSTHNTHNKNDIWTHSISGEEYQNWCEWYIHKIKEKNVWKY